MNHQEAKLGGAVAIALGQGALDADGNVANAVAFVRWEGEHVSGGGDAEEARTELRELCVIGEPDREVGSRANPQRIAAASQQGAETGTTNRLALRREGHTVGATDGHSHAMG